MTVRVPAFIQGASHPAEDVRLEEFGEVIGQGYLGAGDLLVAAQGTPNMSVQVAAGTAFIAGTQSANQGYYKSRNDASVTLTIAASDPTNPRIDLVVLKVQDAFYSGGTNAASLAVVTGTPAASPVAPAAPANSMILAQVRVNATVTSVTNANITDQRTQHKRLAHWFQADQPYQNPLKLQRAASQTAMVLPIFDVNGTTLLGGFDSSGNLAPPGSFPAWSVNWLGITGTTNFGRYTNFGGICHGEAQITITATSGSIGISLPFNVAAMSVGVATVGTAMYRNGTTVASYGLSVPFGSSTAYLYPGGGGGGELFSPGWAAGNVSVNFTYFT